MRVNNNDHVEMSEAQVIVQGLVSVYIEYFESFLYVENIMSVYKRTHRSWSGDLTGVPETNESCLPHSCTWL